MKSNELNHIILAILVLTIVVGFLPVLEGNFNDLGKVLLFSTIIIGTNILGKKFVAHALDAQVEHEIWQWSRYGFKPSWHLKKPIPVGVILPLIMTLFSLGVVKFMTLLTYETTALKRRAARRFGHYSFTEMTDWHIALIGAAGIVTTLFISFISYWIPGLEGLPSLATFYAFFNLIPISKLDGCQIYFGSRTLWAILATITIIFTGYAFLLV